MVQSTPYLSSVTVMIGLSAELFLAAIKIGENEVSINLSRSELSTAIRNVASQVRMEGDEDIAHKLQELADRAASGDRTIRVAFCGLFSAGKTSLLNALCSRTDLATGAVPTTALVTEVALPGTSIVCLDTPGVDSTDEAHQAATEAALHLADAVALVMDYQQVESDTNLELAESFVHRGKPLYLIINQVDKHMDFELSFSEYKERIERTFSDWGIEPKGIFYTSTRSANDEGLLTLRQCLTSLDEQIDVKDSLIDAAVRLVQEHIEFQFDHQIRATDDRVLNVFGEVPYDAQEAIHWRDERIERLQQRQSEMQKQLHALLVEKQSLETAIARAIDLAQVSPYETTELGRHYVESLRPHFKIGWIQSASKTENERANRLRKFAADLGQRTEKFLVWPIQTMMREALQTSSWAHLEWLSDVERLTIEVTEEGCRSAVKMGALISEQYPYQYVKDVVQATKGAFRGKVMSLLDEWFERVRQEHERDCQNDSEVLRLNDEIDAADEWLQVRVQMEESGRTLVRSIEVKRVGKEMPGGQQA